jgi:hypothetical protein
MAGQALPPLSYVGRRSFFQGRATKGAGIKDIVWLKPDGQEMTDQEWNQQFARSWVCCFRETPRTKLTSAVSAFVTVISLF